MPFARFENFEECTFEQSKLGHSKEDSEKICGEIKDRAEKGILYKAVDSNLEVLSKGNDELVVGGFSTWELVDPERDIITTKAQVSFLQKLFALPPEYQAITVNHKEFKLGTPVLKYTNGEGQEFFSHVNEKGTYLISKIRNDNLRTTQIYREKIKKGLLASYSITGLPLTSEIVKAEDGQPARRVDDIEPWSVTLCEKDVMKAVNPKAEVQVISQPVNVSKATVPAQIDMSKPLEAHVKQEAEQSISVIKDNDIFQLVSNNLPYVEKQVEPIESSLKKEMGKFLDSIHKDGLFKKISTEPVVTVNEEDVFSRHGFNQCNKKTSIK